MKKSTYTCFLRTHVYVVVLYLVGVLSIFVCIYIYTYDRCLQSDVFFRFCLQGIFISERDFIKCYTLCVCHCFQVKSTSSSPLLNTVTVPVPNENTVYKMFSRKQGIPSRFSDKKTVHSKTKYNAHARSPAIGQPHIVVVPVFRLKRPGSHSFVYVL